MLSDNCTRIALPYPLAFVACRHCRHHRTGRRSTKAWSGQCSAAFQWNMSIPLSSTEPSHNTLQPAEMTKPSAEAASASQMTMA